MKTNLPVVPLNRQLPVEQIRSVFEDNLGIIIVISP